MDFSRFVARAISAIPPLKIFTTMGKLGKVLSWGWTFTMGGTGTVAGGLITGSVDSWETAGLAFAIGGVANVLGRGISEKIAKVKASKICNQSNKAKSLAIQKLQAHPSNLGPQAMKGTLRNTFKQTAQHEVAGLLTNANPLRFAIYSTISSSILSGWY